MSSSGDRGQETANARLRAIAERVGLAVWSLQSLERSAAQFLAGSECIRLDMDGAAAELLLAKLEKKTFGQVVKDLIKAESLSDELKSLLKVMVHERNWLIHRSRFAERTAPYSGTASQAVIEKIEAIRRKCLLVHDELAQAASALAQANGVDPRDLQEQAEQLLQGWREGSS
jgi:hypothetical protein